MKYIRRKPLEPYNERLEKCKNNYTANEVNKLGIRWVIIQMYYRAKLASDDICDILGIDQDEFGFHLDMIDQDAQ